MKYKSLTNGPPVCMPCWGEEVECQDQGEAEQDGNCRKERRDEEHHDGGPYQTNKAGVPGKVLEGWPENKNNFD